VADNGHHACRIVDVVTGQADLLHVVAAFHPVGGLPDLLHGRQKKSNQDRNNRDDDE
jgi:putative copper export protein